MSENISGAPAPQQVAVRPPEAAEEPQGPRWLVWIGRFNTLLAGIGGVVVIGMMVHTVADVTARTFSGSSLPDTLAIVQYAWMPTLISLGLGYALLRGEHLSVDLLTAGTSARTQRILAIVGMIFLFVTTCLLMWFGFDSAEQAMQRDERATGANSVVIWPYRWVVLLGLFSLALQSVAELVRATVVRDYVPPDSEIPPVDDDTLVLDRADGSVAKEVGTR